jgi:hypothetical protein
MDLDIIRKVKISHLKASFENLNFRHKFFLLLCLFSLSATLMPHAVFGQEADAYSNSGPALVFDTGSTDYEDYVDQRTQDLTDIYYEQQARQQAMRQTVLAEKVKVYLAAHNSPLADYSSTLVSMRNWKKIIALSNAESTMCRRYPVALANCWGIGGSDLWDMGDNLGQGVISMNQFLNKYPRRSHVKYAEMSFENMNGLYKQPPADHWVYNNKSVYEELIEIENSIK